MPEQHDIVIREAMDGFHVWCLTASCGWSSPHNPFATLPGAETEGDAHILAVLGPDL